MKTKQIKFNKGVNRINFPVLYPKDFRDEIRKIEKLKLPKYSCIGFESRYYKETKNTPEFTSFEVFIEK